jgi:CheY-like chemotaxis protein
MGGSWGESCSWVTEIITTVGNGGVCMERLRALVIEDIAWWSEIIREELENCGCEVDIASNHNDARRYIERGYYDLVTLDMALSVEEERLQVPMPVRGGWRLLMRTLQQQSPESTYFVISASFSTAPHLAFELRDKYGVQGFMTKGDDFNPATLRDWVERVRQSKARRQRSAMPIAADPTQRHIAKPLPAAEPSTTIAPSTEAALLHLTLRFELDRDEVGIAWEADVIGRRKSRFESPFRGADLSAVIHALDLLQHFNESLHTDEIGRLEALGLSTAEGRPLPAVHHEVGRALYRALTVDLVGATALSTMRDLARHERRGLALRLHFPPNAIELAALPWELLWDQGLLPILFGHEQLGSCTRHLDLAESLPPPRTREGPLRILAIAPHAGVNAEARAQEGAERRTAWAPLLASGAVVMDEVSPATRRSLIDYRNNHPQPDIVHFVGHGRYAQGQGWLVLDRGDGAWDRVPTHQLLPLFGGARLVVLNACQGAMIGEAGLLTGIAPALSAAGVPAVVAMQLTVRTTAAVRFSEVMYESLARNESLQHAVVQARRALYVEEPDSVSWYVPTLTIRTREVGPFYLLAS